ncbi:hypothetical protein SODALDRAFT_77465 [Sodiomyces alkalinus F11]|uniref:Uncharacterized protein n=1 Tax=Sodiomyces alkalinus (strain CBS 110278 / VKM F-3762 / F11) TaxID=1314773 RepID=A0A3N2PKN0_SODAK|nr:hypothetical protein SODALDRAFT_77465 [Sodiomyces alkalinus F11]ROT35081.1 hypothetical protein SODALDRAFT_77465 [Sodiomyces alkalinus F11]
MWVRRRGEADPCKWASYFGHVSLSVLFSLSQLSFLSSCSLFPPFRMVPFPQRIPAHMPCALTNSAVPESLPHCGAPFHWPYKGIASGNPSFRPRIVDGPTDN